MATRAQIEAVTEAALLTPPWGQEYVGPAFTSDPEAVFSLMVALTDHQRASMVRLLYRARVAPAAFRPALEFAWTQSHHYGDVLKVARTWRQFVRWCRYAAFPLPTDTPDPVTIYRGAQGVNEKEALWGAVSRPSWTLSRDKAKWFANRWDHLSDGVVVGATVPRGAIMFYSSGRQEQEVIPETLPPPGWHVL